MPDPAPNTPDIFREISEGISSAQNLDDVKKKTQDSLNAAASGTSTFAENAKALSKELDDDWKEIEASKNTKINELKKQVLAQYLEFILKNIAVPDKQPPRLAKENLQESEVQEIYVTESEKSEILKQATDTLVTELAKVEIPNALQAKVDNCTKSLNAISEAFMAFENKCGGSLSKLSPELQMRAHRALTDSLTKLSAALDTVKGQDEAEYNKLINRHGQLIAIINNAFPAVTRAEQAAVAANARHIENATGLHDANITPQNNPILWIITKIFGAKFFTDNNGVIVGWSGGKVDRNFAVATIAHSLTEQKEWMRMLEDADLPKELRSKTSTFLFKPKAFPTVQTGADFDVKMREQQNIRRTFINEVTKLKGNKNLPAALDYLNMHPLEVTMTEKGAGKLAITQLADFIKVGPSKFGNFEGYNTPAFKIETARSVIKEKFPNEIDDTIVKNSDDVLKGMNRNLYSELLLAGINKETWTTMEKLHTVINTQEPFKRAGNNVFGTDVFIALQNLNSPSALPRMEYRGPDLYFRANAPAGEVREVKLENMPAIQQVQNLSEFIQANRGSANSFEGMVLERAKQINTLADYKTQTLNAASHYFDIRIEGMNQDELWSDEMKNTAWYQGIKMKLELAGIKFNEPTQAKNASLRTADFVRAAFEAVRTRGEKSAGWTEDASTPPKTTREIAGITFETTARETGNLNIDLATEQKDAALARQEYILSTMTFNEHQVFSAIENALTATAHDPAVVRETLRFDGKWNGTDPNKIPACFSRMEPTVGIRKEGTEWKLFVGDADKTPNEFTALVNNFIEADIKTLPTATTREQAEKGFSDFLTKLGISREEWFRLEALEAEMPANESFGRALFNTLVEQERKQNNVLPVTMPKPKFVENNNHKTILEKNDGTSQVLESLPFTILNYFKLDVCFPDAVKHMNSANNVQWDNLDAVNNFFQNIESTINVRLRALRGRFQ